MSFVKSVVLAAFAASVVACGGAGELAENTGSGTTDVELATSEQGICEGYQAGAVCTVRCTSTSSWFYIYGVAYGQCEAAGAATCGRSPSGACWSR